MPKKITVGILFGGKSAEHEVSIRSAENVVAALDKKKYTPVLIKIGKDGRWRLDTTGEVVTLLPSEKGLLHNLENPKSQQRLDVVFPILHGPFGEDGTVQGLLKLAEVPFVGASVLGSAVGMDKDVMKRLLRDAGIAIADFVVLYDHEKVDAQKLIKRLGLPCFVKPANLGSSVGVSKVKSEQELLPALKKAFEFDRKVLIEEAIVGREIECAVLGNDDPRASIPGEVIPTRDFYSYEAKYLDENGAALEVPADLPVKTISEIQSLAVKTFKVLECAGLGRVDFFLTKKGQLLVNEINTIPGFTSISMYPRMWGATKIPYPKLIDRLIQLALERFKQENRLKTSRL